MRAELHDLADRLAAIDPRQLPDDDLEDSMLEAERVRNAAHALSAAMLAEFQSRAAWAEDGARSGAAWVAARSGGSTRDATRRQQVGAGLRLLPDVEATARRGRLSPDHLERLAACARRHPHHAARDEALLAQLAERLRADDFTLAARHWSAAAADATQPDPADATQPLRGDATQPDPVHAATEASHPTGELHASTTLDGTLVLSGTLHGDDARLAAAAIDARLDTLLRAARDGDPSLQGRTIPQLRAQALVDLLTQTMRREPSDRSAPDRYRVAVLVPASRDADRELTPTQAVALCDAPAHRAVLGAAGEVLDIGRQTERWPVAIRRAITLRDGGCTFPGCDRPASWCDVHHCQPWSTGGATNLDNGALLCRRHHTFVHAKRWRVVIPRARAKPVVHRRDGTPYIIQRWPRPTTRTG